MTVRWYGGTAVGGCGVIKVHWLRLTMAFSVALASLAGLTQVAAAQSLPPYRGTAAPSEPGSELTVYLMTMGPGRAVWERFGHNAIWIHDPVQGTDKAYNYGLFDLQQENFLVRFLQGRMWYWMQGFPAQSYVEAYRRENRSVWVQELRMPPNARQELQEFLEWNERPENRFYHYDYYKDNCSTRVRDALDRALGGLVRERTAGLATGTTYRFHTQRLTANDPFVYTGLLLALGQPVDRPISAWEEMFLPLALREHLRDIVVPDGSGGDVPLVRSERTLFQSTSTPPPARPPFWWPIYLALGLALGTGAAALGSAARNSSTARAGLIAVSGIWTLLVGISGLVLLGLWALTDHTAAYKNENLFQANLLALALVWIIPRAASRPLMRRRAFVFAVIIAGLALAGLLLKLLPGFYQVNGEIIALALPVHLGIATGLWLLSRPASS